MPEFQLRKGRHRVKSLSRILIQLLESEVRENPVLPHHRHEVRRDADHQKIQQRNQSLERNPIFL